MLSDGLGLRSTLFTPSNPGSKRALLLEWSVPGSKVVQWGVFDPRCIKVKNLPSVPSSVLYESISTPDLEDKMYSSLSDGSLMIDSSFSENKIVDLWLYLRRKSHGLACVEFVPSPDMPSHLLTGSF